MGEIHHSYDGKYEDVSLRDIQYWLSLLEPPYPKMLISILLNDGRLGARKLGQRLEREQAVWTKERRRLRRMLELEKDLWNTGHSHVAGVDEAGRGPLAGPIVAAAVVLPEGANITGINDSKLLKAADRERLINLIRSAAIGVGTAVIEAEEIDRIGIQRANLQAMFRAVQGLPVVPDYVLFDGYAVEGLGIPCRAVVKGDRRSMTVAAASIVAKVTRDEIMVAWDKEFPQYAFHEHKGYCTASHLEAIERFGPCPIHRRSFLPVKNRLEQIPLRFEQDVTH